MPSFGLRASWSVVLMLGFPCAITSVTISIKAECPGLDDGAGPTAASVRDAGC